MMSACRENRKHPPLDGEGGPAGTGWGDLRFALPTEVVPPPLTPPREGEGNIEKVLRMAMMWLP